ncbi:MAG: MMPL family transporter [Solirubrobacterales bacterium]
MLDALAAAAWKRPWAFLGAALVLLGALVALAAGARGELGHPVGGAPAGGEVVVVTTAEGTVSGNVYDVALEAVTAGLEAGPGIGRVSVLEPAGEDGTAELEVDVRAASAAEQRQIVEGLAAQIDPGPLRVAVEGRIAELLAAEEAALEGLWRLELLVVPLALLLLVAALGLRLTAGPVLVAGIAVAGGVACLTVTGGLTDLSVLGVVAAGGVGLALGTELPALLVARWEDEVRLGTPEQALRSTLADGVGSICFTAACAALGAGAIIVAFARDALDSGLSMALGGAFAALFATIGCLLTMPALLALDARRGEEPRRERRLATAAGAIPRVLARGRARTLAAVAVAVLACAALAYPALDAPTQPLAETPARSFTAQLAIVAAAAAAVLVVAFAVRSRSWRSAPVAVLALLPAAAALGLVTLVFNDGASAFGLALDEPRTPTTGGVALALVVLAAVASARTAAMLDAVLFERDLDPGPPGVAERAAQLTIPGALVSTVVVGAAFAVMTGGELHAAHELGVMVAAGLLIDLLVVRPPALAALARWGAPTDRPRSGRWRLRWPRWPTRRRHQEPTASPT